MQRGAISTVAISQVGKMKHGEEMACLESQSILITMLEGEADVPIPRCHLHWKDLAVLLGWECQDFLEHKRSLSQT